MSRKNSSRHGRYASISFGRPFRSYAGRLTDDAARSLSTLRETKHGQELAITVTTLITEAQMRKLGRMLRTVAKSQFFIQSSDLSVANALETKRSGWALPDRTVRLLLTQQLNGDASAVLDDLVHRNVVSLSRIG